METAEIDENIFWWTLMEFHLIFSHLETECNETVHTRPQASSWCNLLISSDGIHFST